MFVLTTLVYPVVLALLCIGAGLLVDRGSGGFLPGGAAAGVGAAALIAVSQLSTYVYPAGAGDPLPDGRGRAGRLRARRGRGCARSPGARAVPGLAAARARARLCPGARAGAARGSAHLLLLHGPVGLRRAHDGRRLPDPSRPGLRAPGPAQLLRPVHQHLLQHELPLRLGHALRRQRLPAAPAPDLGLPAVQRVHARHRRRPGVAARAADRARRRLGRAGGADAPPCRRSSTATSCSARSRRSPRCR